MSTYAVIVGNIGTVHTGTNQRQARHVYREYVDMVQLSTGRCAGEDVTLMRDNEIEIEYTTIEATHKGDTIMELTPSKQYELRVKDGSSQILTQKDVLKAYPKQWTFRAYGKVGEKIQVAQGELVRVR